MRTRKRKRKISGRLGYNPTIQVWFGTKKKWERAKVFRKTSGESGKQASGGRVNPRERWTNERRRNPPRSKRPIRRKDEHRKQVNRRTGRKARYAGVKRQPIQVRVDRQRKGYQRIRNERNRLQLRGVRRRKGGNPGLRFGRHERRVDVRRWRSGRVNTIQRARDRREEKRVWRLGANGDPTKRLTKERQGKLLKPGEGRKVEEARWKQRKPGREDRKKIPENQRYARRYREVDYVTGRRRVVRAPRSGERPTPKGRGRTRTR